MDPYISTQTNQWNIHPESDSRPTWIHRFSCTFEFHGQDWQERVSFENSYLIIVRRQMSHTTTVFISHSLLSHRDDRSRSGHELSRWNSIFPRIHARLGLDPPRRGCSLCRYLHCCDHLPFSWLSNPIRRWSDEDDFSARSTLSSLHLETIPTEF